VAGAGGTDGNGDFAMGPDDVFLIEVYGYSTAMTVASGAMYGDDFQTTGFLPTVAATLFPGGPPTKPESDCYLELLVEGASASQITDGKVLVCRDGSPCDAGPAGDDRCDVRLAGCVNQTDPALPACTPPTALASAKIKGKLAIDVSALLQGPRCTSVVQASVPVKRNKKNAYLAGKSKLRLKGKAKAPKGTSPRTDADKWTIQCEPAS
jgi:hypothetical protein